MAKSLTITTPEQMRQLGAGLGAIVRAGDVLVLTGDLGAGKTTLTQGLGQALGARGRITSPTYTISRLHPTAAGPTLAHVDAYRVTDMWDFETIDLEALIPTAITVIEWGEALIEALDIPYLHLTITRDDGTDELSDMGERRVTFQTHGDRWAQRIDLHQLQAVLEAEDT